MAEPQPNQTVKSFAVYSDTMADDSQSGYSEAEEELIEDFVRKHAERSRYLEGPPLIPSDPEDQLAAREALNKVAAISAGRINDLDIQIHTLKRLEMDIKRNSNAIINPGEKLPDGAKITADDLNKMLVAEDVVTFFALSGGVMERASIDLITEEVVDENRMSNRVREDIEDMTQYRREWLLYTTGVISSGEKGRIREAYQMRNDIVHNPEEITFLEVIDNIEEDVDFALDAIDILVKQLYGHGIEEGIHYFPDVEG